MLVGDYKRGGGGVGRPDDAVHGCIIVAPMADLAFTLRVRLPTTPRCARKRHAASAAKWDDLVSKWRHLNIAPTRLAEEALFGRFWNRGDYRDR